MNSVIMRADEKFKEMINRIRNTRRQAGKDKRDLSDRRLTLAISRIPDIEKYIINSNIKEDKSWKEGIN